MEISNLFFSASDLKRQFNELGKGPYGTVYIAETIDDSSKYAVKIYDLDYCFDGNDQALFIKESFKMQKLNHPAIAKLVGINFMSLINPLLHKPTIILDYFPNKSLKNIFDDEINSSSQHNWTLTKKYINLLGICDAARYLYDQGITHLNLKPENILLDLNYNPHISDYYQILCFPKLNGNLAIQDQSETLIYKAPEILQGDYDYDESVDVYAFSMIAYQIITGKVPFCEIIESSSLRNAIIKGDRPKLPESVPKNVQDLLSRCWNEKPNERPKFKEIYSILSSDMINSFEKVDENEIHKYIDLINDSRREQSETIDKRSIEEQIKDLKSILFHCFGKFCSGNDYDQLKDYFYQHAMETNNKDTLYEIGNDFFKPCQLVYEYDKAKYCYDRAAELGNTKSYEKLGDIYYYGYGIEKNYSKAKYYYEKAYENGNKQVCSNLGNIHRYGLGVEINKVKAEDYYKISPINKKGKYWCFLIPLCLFFLMMLIIVTLCFFDI